MAVVAAARVGRAAASDASVSATGRTVLGGGIAAGVAAAGGAEHEPTQACGHHDDGGHDEQTIADECLAIDLRTADRRAGESENPQQAEACSSQSALGQAPVRGTIDPLPAGLRSETHGRFRPDVGRGFRVETPAIAGAGGLIVFQESVIFGGAAPGGSVVQSMLQHMGAKFVPVGAAIDQMQVPSLVDLIGRGDRVAGSQGEEEKASVFFDDPSGESEVPTVLAGQSLSEAQRVADVIQFKGDQPFPKGIFVQSHDTFEEGLNFR